LEWTLLKLLTWTTDYFKKRGIPSARLDAELLLADTLRLTRVQLYTRFDQPLGAEELAAYKARVARRANREPVAYILGRKEFWGLDFAVGPGVLLPRPDTERLVEEAVKLLGPRPRPPRERRSLPWNAQLASSPAAALPNAGAEPVFQVGELEPEAAPPMPGEAAASRPPASVAGGAEAAGADSRPPVDATPTPALVLDLCTGSAIIPICIARETGARVVGVDLSPEALEYARRNVEAHALSSQVGLLQGDLSAPVPPRFHGKFDLLTANPPYIAAARVDELEPEISRHEPRQALAGGPDGLDFYHRIAREVSRMVKPGGWVLLEIGDEQGPAVQEILAGQGMEALEVLRDLAGAPRVVKGRRPA
jgi:release factor glutamine methyltransferase